MLFSFLQVLFLETRLRVKMINSLRFGPMAELKLTTWKRSRRKEARPRSYKTCTNDDNNASLANSSTAPTTDYIDICLTNTRTVIGGKFSFARVLVYVLIADKFQLHSCAPLRPYAASVSPSSVVRFHFNFLFLIFCLLVSEDFLLHLGSCWLKFIFSYVNALSLRFSCFSQEIKKLILQDQA